MVAPLVGLAVGAVARAAAKKAATSAVKKVATVKRAKIMADATKKAEANKIAKTIAKKPESSVKVVPARGKSYNKVANQKEAERLARTARSKTASSKDLRGTARQDYEVAKVKVSKNVTARVPAKSNYEFAKDMSQFGKIQKQNAGPLKPTKAEAKANARGLKAAQKPTNKTGSKSDRTERKIVNENFNAPAKSNYVKQLRREGTSPRKTKRGK
jgi:hypothetical protein